MMSEKSKIIAINDENFNKYNTINNNNKKTKIIKKHQKKLIPKC